jgi:ribulose-bisphosphate carboxylase large chain
MPDAPPPRPESPEPGLRMQNVSKIFRFQGAGGDFAWSGVPLQDYKPLDDSWRGVTRRVLVGQTGESPLFHVRYFEIAPGGYTTLERHRHEHAVMVLRGRGQVLIGCETRDVAFGDTVYVAPGDPHQFRNDHGPEPFGFLCVVNAVRDRPVAAESGFCAICE